MEKTTFDTSGQSVQKSPEGLFLQDGIAGLRSLPRHSVDMLLTDPPYGTTRNFWDVPLPLPELWEAVKWAVKPRGGAVFAQCPYDKVLGASNLPMLRYEWVWYKSRCTGFLNARRAPLKKTENILVFYQKLPLYNPQFEQGKPYKKIAGNRGDSTNYGKFIRSGSGSEDGLRFPGNVLAFPTVQRTIHPTQKPVELCEYFIKTYTRPGEVVADICAGSGTTAVAAMNTSRRFICFENAPSIYTIAAQRIEQARLAMAAGKYGVWIKPVYCELTDTAALKEAFRQVMADKQPLNVLVNNAGIMGEDRMFQMTSAEDMHRIMDVNFFAMVEVSRLATRLMARNKCGAVVNIASVAGIEGDSRLDYSASKAAVIAATKKMARELISVGIRVNALAPGFTDTEPGERAERKGDAGAAGPHPHAPKGPARGDRGTWRPSWPATGPAT